MPYRTIGDSSRRVQSPPLAVVDLLDDKTDLEGEQRILDEHDDEVIQLTIRLDEVIAGCSSVDSNQPKIATKRLKGISTILEGISSLPTDDDRSCLIQ